MDKYAPVDEEGYEPVGSSHTLSDSHDCKLVGGSTDPTKCDDFKPECLKLQGTCHVTDKPYVEKKIEDRRTS